MKKHTIKATILFEQPFWTGIFERQDKDGYAVARQVFGKEPTDAELYEFVSTHFYALKFTEPNQHFQLIIKRKNFKRVAREVKKEMQKMVPNKKESYAQEILKLELDKHKKIRKTISKAEKEAKQQEKFLLRQEKKKKKHRGH